MGRGGSRLNSGRAKMNLENKKIVKSIYINPKLLDDIQKLKIKGCNSFSGKCQFLIEKGYEHMITSNIQNNHKLTFIDLFAGIGGIRKGFEDNNTECVFSCEWDKFAQKTYKANFGEIPYGDITKISEQEIPKHDVLLAGFPCQPFSNIGKREGFNHPTQGTLFFDIIRILKFHQPKMLLLENVPGLTTIQKGETFKTILHELDKANYSVFYQILDAQNFNLPQRRKRIIIVGFRKDLNVSSFSFPKGNNKKIPINSILERNVKGYSISKHLQRNYLFKKNDGKPAIVNFNSTNVVGTLVSTYHKIQRLTGTFVEDGETGLRLFSELECKRLMGFPDDFIIPVSRTQMYKQLGNSVAVPMIKAVSIAMKEKLYNVKKEIEIDK